MTNAITTRLTGATQVLRPQTFEQLSQFAAMAARSSMVPKDYRGNPEDIMLAVQMGSEVGLAPMQALQNIATINGRPALWGDAQLGLCKMHPEWVSIEETTTGAGEAMQALCVVIRNGEPPVVREFGYTDAKQAGLWGKAGPWTQYPARMMQMRARGFALRDAFPDALRGLLSEHEAQDTPPPAYAGTTIEATATPVAEPAQAEPDEPWTLDTAPNPAVFLAILGPLLDAAQDADAVDAILAHKRVQSAQDRFVNSRKAALMEMIQAALARTAPPSTDVADSTDDGWPGQTTTEKRLIAAALARTAPPPAEENDGWPGPVKNA